MAKHGYDVNWRFGYNVKESKRYFVIRRPWGSDDSAWKNYCPWWNLFNFLSYDDRRTAMASALRFGRKDPAHEYGVYWWREFKSLKRYYMFRDKKLKT